MYEFSTHPLADPWLILVRPQWNGQSQTGLRPYPRSCDHEFTGLWVVSRQEKIHKLDRMTKKKVWVSSPLSGASVSAPSEKKTCKTELGLQELNSTVMEYFK